MHMAYTLIFRLPFCTLISTHNCQTNYIPYCRVCAQIPNRTALISTYSAWTPKTNAPYVYKSKHVIAQLFLHDTIMSYRALLVAEQFRFPLELYWLILPQLGYYPFGEEHNYVPQPLWVSERCSPQRKRVGERSRVHRREGTQNDAKILRTGYADGAVLIRIPF